MKNMNLKYIALSALAGVALGFFGSAGWYRWVWVRGERSEAARWESVEERAAQGSRETPATSRSTEAVFGLTTNPEHNQTLTSPPKTITLLAARPVVYGRLQLVKEGTPSATVIRTGEPERSKDGKTTTIPFPAGQGVGTYTVNYQICEALTPTIPIPTPATGSSAGPRVVVPAEQLQGSCQGGEFSFTIQ